MCLVGPSAWVLPTTISSSCPPELGPPSHSTALFQKSVSSLPRAHTALSLPPLVLESDSFHSPAFLKINLFFWLRGILAAAVSRDYSLIAVPGFRVEVAYLVAQRGF